MELVREKFFDKIKLRRLDPLKHSLDELIHETDHKVAHCPFFCDEGEFHKITPYQAISFLFHDGMRIEMKIGHLQNPTYYNRSHKWRCVINYGEVYVVADSSRKVVAREMAAFEFLTELPQFVKECKIPEYSVPAELFINPYIFHALEKEATRKCLQVQHEVRVRSVLEPGSSSRETYLFICTYFVGKKTYTGESCKQDYAKLKAAKKAYEGLSGKTFFPTKYFTGGNCDTLLEYIFGEFEMYQAVTILSEEGGGASRSAHQNPKMNTDEKKRALMIRFKLTKKD